MVNLQLVSYIKENKKRGYSKDELIKILLGEGWSKKEIDLAYNFISKHQDVSSKKQAITIGRPKDPLSNFINNSLNKGISEREIRLALSMKGWKQETVNKSFKKIKFPVIVQGKEENPQILPQQKVNFKNSIKYMVYFLVLSFVLSGTSLVYLYIQGMGTYVITTSEGEEVTKACLNEDCSDMKEHALENVYENYMPYILMSMVLTIMMLSIYWFFPYKSQILWLYNILYFAVLVVIAYKWIMFQMS